MFYNVLLYCNVNYCVCFTFFDVLAFAVAAWGCNMLCQTCFMLSIAILHVTRYALHDDC